MVVSVCQCMGVFVTSGVCECMCDCVTVLYLTLLAVVLVWLHFVRNKLNINLNGIPVHES